MKKHRVYFVIIITALANKINKKAHKQLSEQRFLQESEKKLWSSANMLLFFFREIKPRFRIRITELCTNHCTVGTCGETIDAPTGAP